MEIKINTKYGALSICIGHKTAWFDQIYFICVIKEYYEGREVVYGDMVWHS